MVQPYVGEIRMFAGTFAPYQWTLCSGQQMPISQNQVLYSLIGTTYSGDGVSTFGLPDFRGRAPIHMGQGLAGLSNYVIGQVGGAEQVTLMTPTMPQHNHTLNATSTLASSQNISSTALPARMPAGNNFYTVNSGSTAPTLTALAPASVSAVGGSLAHENRMPSLCLNFAIALYGVYPSRN
jgi:microcystin-dependent protein